MNIIGSIIIIAILVAAFVMLDDGNPPGGNLPIV